MAAVAAAAAGTVPAGDDGRRGAAVTRQRLPAIDADAYKSLAPAADTASDSSDSDAPLLMPKCSRRHCNYIGAGTLLYIALAAVLSWAFARFTQTAFAAWFILSLVGGALLGMLSFVASMLHAAHANKVALSKLAAAGRAKELVVADGDELL